VSTIRIILVAGVVLVAAGAFSPVQGQNTKQPPDIRMLLSQPQGPVSSDATAAPSLRDLPQPKMDKPPVEPPITIILGDPRCYPGEDGLQGFAQANRRRRH
jgi:hypothetical protein